MADKVEKKQITAEEYFKLAGLSTEIKQNDFSKEDTIKMFLQAAKDIQENRATERQIKAYVKMGWSVYGTLKKLFPV